MTCEQANSPEVTSSPSERTIQTFETPVRMATGAENAFQNLDENPESCAPPELPYKKSGTSSPAPPQASGGIAESSDSVASTRAGDSALTPNDGDVWKNEGRVQEESLVRGWFVNHPPLVGVDKVAPYLDDNPYITDGFRLLDNHWDAFKSLFYWCVGPVGCLCVRLECFESVLPPFKNTRFMCVCGRHNHSWDTWTSVLTGCQAISVLLYSALLPTRQWLHGPSDRLYVLSITR